jgi:hypothetical protein
MMTVKRSKKWNVINVINFQKWCSLFSKACHYVALFQEFVDTPVNGRPSFFWIDSVHLMETSLSHDLSINTKSMGPTHWKRVRWQVFGVLIFATPHHVTERGALCEWPNSTWIVILWVRGTWLCTADVWGSNRRQTLWPLLPTSSRPFFGTGAGLKHTNLLAYLIHTYVTLLGVRYNIV